MQDKDIWKGYAAFASVSFFWGTTFLAIKIGVETIPPFFFSGVRQVIAGFILSMVFVLLKKKMPSINEFIRISISSFFMIVLANGMVVWAEKYISSGLTSIICAMTPFWVLVINMLTYRNEKPNIWVLVGLVIGFLGLVLIFYDNFFQDNTSLLWGIVGTVIANASWGAGTVYSKNVKYSIEPLFTAGIQMFMGGVMLLVVSLVLEMPLQVHTFTQESWLSLLYLIIFGSLVGYTSYMYALTKLPATIASMYAYINPLVALVLGWLVLNEELDSNTFFATILIFLGVSFVKGGFGKK